MPRNYDRRNTRKYASDEERRMAAYKDWMEGMTYPTLAEKYGYSDRQSAMRAVKLARKTMVEDVAEARDQATERIMGPLLAMRMLAMEGDAQAAGAHKNYEAELAKLHGIYAPVKTDVTSDGKGITINVVKDWDNPEDEPQP